MAINYTKARQTAQRMIRENGRLVMLHTIRDTAPLDPDKPWEVALPTETDHPIYACFVPKDARSSPANQGMVAKEMSHQETRICLVDALTLDTLGVIPNLKDRIIDADGSKWGVTLLNPFQPGMLAVLYEFNLEE
jgi:hypothetical protein